MAQQLTPQQLLFLQEQQLARDIATPTPQSGIQQATSALLSGAAPTVFQGPQEQSLTNTVAGGAGAIGRALGGFLGGPITGFGNLALQGAEFEGARQLQQIQQGTRQDIDPLPLFAQGGLNAALGALPVAAGKALLPRALTGGALGAAGFTAPLVLEDLSEGKDPLQDSRLGPAALSGGTLGAVLGPMLGSAQSGGLRQLAQGTATKADDAVLNAGLAASQQGPGPTSQALRFQPKRSSSVADTLPVGQALESDLPPQAITPLAEEIERTVPGLRENVNAELLQKQAIQEGTPASRATQAGPLVEDFVPLGEAQPGTPGGRLQKILDDLGAGSIDEVRLAKAQKGKLGSRVKRKDVTPIDDAPEVLVQKARQVLDDADSLRIAGKDAIIKRLQKTVDGTQKNLDPVRKDLALIAQEQVLRPLEDVLSPINKNENLRELLSTDFDLNTGLGKQKLPENAGDVRNVGGQLTGSNESIQNALNNLQPAGVRRLANSKEGETARVLPNRIIDAVQRAIDSDATLDANIRTEASGASTGKQGRVRTSITPLFFTSKSNKLAVAAVNDEGKLRNYFIDDLEGSGSGFLDTPTVSDAPPFRGTVANVSQGIREFSIEDILNRVESTAPLKDSDIREIINSFPELINTADTPKGLKRVLTNVVQKKQLAEPDLVRVQKALENPENLQRMCKLMGL